jgi:tetratricopeptide (TPR) repeat protein
MGAYLKLIRLPSFLFMLLQATPRAGVGELPIGVVNHWQYYNNAGWVAFQNRDFVSAEKKFNAGIKILSPYQKDCQPLLARSYTDLARALSSQKKFAAAEPWAKRALQINESDPRIKAAKEYQSLMLLAQIERDLHRDKDAEPLLKRALALQKQALGPDHYQVALTLEDLAGVLDRLGNYPEAERFYSRAIAIHEKINPAENLALADALERYSAYLRRMNRPEAAESNEFRARTIRSTYAALRAKSTKNQSGPGSQQPN